MRYGDLQERIDDLKETQFLRYISDQVHGHTDEIIGVGDVGDALGLPYEEAIRIADELREDGFLHRVGRFNAPHGPGVRLTPAGRRASAA